MGLATACPNDDKVYLGAMTNTSRSNPGLVFWQAIIPVGAYSVPPAAPQPGIIYPVETSLDNRFEQRSVQLGSRIWNVNVISAGTATPQWYEFDTVANSLVAEGIWFASTTSSDWRPSIVMDRSGNTFGTWMSVDAPNNLNISLRFNGGTGDSAGTGSAGTVFTSSQPLTGQTFQGRNRTGDYSYIAVAPFLSPAGCSEALLEGEVTFAPNLWGTRIGLVKRR